MVSVQNSRQQIKIVATYNLKGNFMATATIQTNGQFGAVPSYASRVNAKYSNTASHFQNLKDRWNTTVALYPPNTVNTINSMLKQRIAGWIKLHPTVKTFRDMPLCRAQTARLSDILIDETMQRQLDISWVLLIILNWRSWQAMPIQVYTVGSDASPELEYLGAGKLYASWDGQHTAMAFYIIAVFILGLDPKDVEIPVVIYEVSTKAEIRNNFIQSNSDGGKKLLDKIDIFQQMVYGVRVDGATYPEWLEVEKKQQYLEAADLFLTDEKFKDSDQIGAISRVQDIVDRKVSPELVRQFCVYARIIMGMTPRAINTKEAPIILGFLKMASVDNIEYTDDEITSMAMLCHNLFGADFDASGDFWAQLEVAYLNWWEGFYENVDVSMRPERPRMNKDWTQGGTFFWHILKKNWKDAAGLPMHMPKLNIQTPFLPARQDLF
jgi:hypothetical protein